MPYCVFLRKSQPGVGTRNRKQQWWLVCDFVVCSHVLTFAVIGHNKIKSPKFFYVFTVNQFDSNDSN